MFFRKKSPILKKLEPLPQRVRDLAREVEQTKMLAAKALIRDLLRHEQARPLAQVEFQVFSQFGDDGIIQYLVHRLGLPAAEQRFVEFGVESYAEANTRFLLFNDNWSGLIMDGSEKYMAAVRAADYYWRHDLTALGRFITRENINPLLEEAGFAGRIGLLSVDIDGNDYWVWEAVTVADPAVVIVEYNGLFGAHEPVAVPYQADFTRAQAHHSHFYWGASLPALCHLAAKKGYVWVGCSSAGNNAYFVRKAEASRFLLPQLPADFVAAKYREGRDADGNLNFLGQKSGLDLVKHLPVWNVIENRTCPISDLRFDA